MEGILLCEDKEKGKRVRGSKAIVFPDLTLWASSMDNAIVSLLAPCSSVFMKLYKWSYFPFE